MTGLVRRSGLGWTIVRFIAPKQSGLRIGFFGTDKLGFAVSRADIAAQVDDATYVGRAPATSN
jgi:hypothetical protein